MYHDSTIIKLKDKKRYYVIINCIVAPYPVEVSCSVTDNSSTTKSTTTASHTGGGWWTPQVYPPGVSPNSTTSTPEFAGTNEMDDQDKTKILPIGTVMNICIHISYSTHYISHRHINFVS
eukprot:GHVR01018140.1.p1 GENE.GHVR01018140.1~~GHVR01018140.1.p1  ORF type:complete len:120 (-),score=2.50 GHVR01018140.1:614-973(-)